MAVKVLRWLIIVFPLLILLSVLGIFQSQLKDLILLTLVAIVVTMGPSVAYKLNVPIGAMKYITTLALGALVALMATDPTIGIYMTYALAMVFSIFYYDKKLTKRISIISFVLLVISLYFRSLHVQQIEFDTNFTWFFSRSLGFALEAIVMSIVCVKIAEVSHNMLLKFADTQQTENSITSLESGMNEVSSFATTIADITKQTNLLALNASIEAARAGDMVKQMQELVANTLQQANQIVLESETQKGVTSEVQDTFHQVDDVSRDLLEMSKR